MEQQKNSMIGPAGRVNSMYMSMIRTFRDKAENLKTQGKPVLSLTIGEPNFNTPHAIKEATIQALLNNYTHYSSTLGYLPLRQAIAEKTKEDMDLDYDPETEILVTASCAEAINNSLLTYLNAGDEIIIFTPAFINYENIALLAGATVVDIPLKKENGFQICPEEVEAAVTPKTRALFINNPCNPTGVVYQPEVLRRLSEIACKYNLLVFSDEIYNNLVYDNRKFVSVASFPGMRERTLLLNGFSKTYAMTGWRLGYICADKHLIPPMEKLHLYSTGSSPTFIQVGASESMNLPETKREVLEMVRQFDSRRKLVMDALDRIPKLSYVVPDGAFYFFIDVSATGLSGEEYCTRLLEESYVAAVPGIGLGKAFGDFIRISYAVSDETLRECMKRIAEFTASL